MIYSWKLPGLYPVSAQTAGEELARICAKNDGLRPEDIVDESRPASAPLHPCFEWDDPTAAELYRQHQARGIVRCITTTVDASDGPVETRAFVRAERPAYQPIQAVINTVDEMTALFDRAKDELFSFRRKYENLAKLDPVFKAIDELEG